MGIGDYLAESVAVSVCSSLEQRGIISRYIASTKPFAEHPPGNIFAVGLPYIPLYYAISQAWPTFVTHAVSDFSPLSIWLFVVAVMLVHDTWFFACHTMFHTFRRPYRHIHSMHHRLGASCSAFGNAYADALDIGLCFVSFHAVLFVYLYYQPSWNPVAVILLVVVEVVTNIVGKLLLLVLFTVFSSQNVAGMLHTGMCDILPVSSNSSTFVYWHNTLTCREPMQIANAPQRALQPAVL